MWDPAAQRDLLPHCLKDELGLRHCFVGCIDLSLLIIHLGVMASTASQPAPGSEAFMFYSRLPQAQLNEHQESVSGVGRVHSDLERLKEISPLLYFLFPLPFTLVMDTQGEFLLSSKSYDYWRRENG